MSNAEQNFRESLRTFNASSAGRTGAGNPNSGFSFSTYFGGESGNGPGQDEATESLLGRFRTGTQNAFSGLGLGGQQETELFGLSRWQRLVGFVVTLGLSIFCFMIAFLTLPMLALKPAKFATLYTMGSVLALIR
ncbi:hypothetical protein SpCBS45565_g02031 [Spizellomyces sp. 'palustris']|nr:hypothetical protein SpCBS45565_g02031 [Spizellomyces sp. 'palustris']